MKIKIRSYGKYVTVDLTAGFHTIPLGMLNDDELADLIDDVQTMLEELSSYDSSDPK